jgi:hypothetical protein
MSAGTRFDQARRQERDRPRAPEALFDPTTTVLELSAQPWVRHLPFVAVTAWGRRPAAGGAG